MKYLATISKSRKANKDGDISTSIYMPIIKKLEGEIADLQREMTVVGQEINQIDKWGGEWIEEVKTNSAWIKDTMEIEEAKLPHPMVPDLTVTLHAAGYIRTGSGEWTHKDYVSTTKQEEKDKIFRELLNELCRWGEEFEFTPGIVLRARDLWNKLNAV